MNKLTMTALAAGAAFSLNAAAQEGSVALRIAPSPLLTVDQHRSNVVDGIVATWHDALVTRFGATAAAQETRLRASLMGLRSDRLLAASLVDSLAAVDALLGEAQDDATKTPRALLKNLGDQSADLTYTPVNPCRIADTRNAGGALAANTTRTFIGYNASSFASQGGTASNCNIPSGVAAIAMNVYAINPTNLGFIKVWAANASEPSVATINYQVGITAIANGATVPVDAAHSNQFDAKSPAVVHFVADVVGYFKAPGDATGLDILANGERVTRYEYNAQSPNVISGSSANNVTSGAMGAAIGGGGASGTSVFVPPGLTINCGVGGCANRVTNYFGTIGGGIANQAGSGLSINVGFLATVGGGGLNTASGATSTVAGGSVNAATSGGDTVGGGYDNVASGGASVIAGGSVNRAGGSYSTVAGGLNNNASGYGSTVVGGQGNTASGLYSLAAGSNAQAFQDGCFVWADASTTDPIGCFENTFVVRAFGGVAMATGGSNPNYSGARLAAGSGSWSSFSDRNGKDNVAPTNPNSVLEAVTALPIATWNWKAQSATIRHMGPMAQDFYAAFGLGEDDTHISAVDIEGVALAAIQGLNGRLQAKIEEDDREIAELRTRLERLELLLNQRTR
jgi:hypothetical protein